MPRSKSCSKGRHISAIEEKSDFYFVYSEQKAIIQLKVSSQLNKRILQTNKEVKNINTKKGSAVIAEPFSIHHPPDIPEEIRP